MKGILENLIKKNSTTRAVTGVSQIFIRQGCRNSQGIEFRDNLSLHVGMNEKARWKMISDPPSFKTWIALPKSSNIIQISSVSKHDAIIYEAGMQSGLQSSPALWWSENTIINSTSNYTQNILSSHEAWTLGI